MTPTTKPVWDGAKSLRRFLVPVEDLEPFPGNPRRGDVESLRVSLRRFGQVLPVLADPALGESGKQRIVARHHLVLAAAEEGWTHVAVIPHEFRDEDEARAYLLADNKIADLGTYDLDELVGHLRVLQEIDDGFVGTGYSNGDLDDLLAEQIRLQQESPLAPDDTKREHRDPSKKELVLIFSPEQLEQVETWMRIVAKEKGTAGSSETVYAALDVAARTLNQGA